MRAPSGFCPTAARSSSASTGCSTWARPAWAPARRRLRSTPRSDRQRATTGGGFQRSKWAGGSWIPQEHRNARAGGASYASIGADPAAEEEEVADRGRGNEDQEGVAHRLRWLDADQVQLHEHHIDDADA